MSPSLVAIHYRRLPDRVSVFRQAVLEETPEYIVTFVEAVELAGPAVASSGVILEPGAPVIWFTYPGHWHDVGRFHLRDGSFTGCYANVLTPVRISGERWDTTDLCLDVWVGAGGEVEILDEDDFAEAVRRGWVDDATAATARHHADDLARQARKGAWPPPHVYEWDLARARARLRELTGS
jgi:predicted RNA-binding protein associated with RNAse of E/G family